MRRYVAGMWAVACASLSMCIFGQSAKADQIYGFCNFGNELQANARCIHGANIWLYGVGVGGGALTTPGTVCAGAKTNRDGSGGNALPFRCEYIDPQGLISFWTPGGSSNWGYATIINRSSHFVWVSGVLRTT